MRILLAISLFLLFSANRLWAFNLVYKLETVSGELSYIEWDIKRLENHYEMISTDRRGIRTFISAFDGSIQQFQYADFDNRVYFRGKINEDQVLVSNLIDHRLRSESFESYSPFWYQPLGFSFFDFALSEDRSRKIFMVNPDDLKPVELTIRKKGMESIVINNREIEAIKAELRLNGLLAPLWHGTYWLCPQRGILLRYIGTFGPGTEKTHMELTSSQGDILFASRP